MAKSHLTSSNYSVFTNYVAEAVFYYPHILADIEKFNKEKSNLALLELGGGLGILSLLLSLNGLQVYCQEPSGEGFAFMSEMYDLTVGRFVSTEDIEGFYYCTQTTSFTNFDTSFDYVFSVNVFEHVDSVPQLLSDLSLALSPLSVIRVICPNSFFPSEPHFRIPIIINKPITSFVFKSKILRRSESLPGVWASLNFINISSLKRDFKSQFVVPSYRLHFDFQSNLIIALLGRSDKPFLDRQASPILHLCRHLLNFSIFRLSLRLFCRSIFSPYVDVSVRIIRE